MSQILELHKQVEHFKRWAKSIDDRNGEWECNYEHWQELWASAVDVITMYHDGSIPAVVADNLIYALARDNECEYIRENLLDAPELIATLSKYVITKDDADAKWQIAILIAETELPHAADLLRPFLTDIDEYVRRRSLIVFARFVPEEAETIAIEYLDAEFEYTRIAALHVLYTVRSRQLNASLDRLADDSNEYVRRKVKELRDVQHNCRSTG